MKIDSKAMMYPHWLSFCTSLSLGPILESAMARRS